MGLLGHATLLAADHGEIFGTDTRVLVAACFLLRPARHPDKVPQRGPHRRRCDAQHIERDLEESPLEV
jgi:hypothetical protein